MDYDFERIACCPARKSYCQRTIESHGPNEAEAKYPVSKRLLLVSQILILVHALIRYARFYIFTGPTTHEFTGVRRPS